MLYLHRVCLIEGVRMEGSSTFDGAQMFFYKNCSSIVEGRVIPDAFAAESLWSSLIYHQLTYGAKNYFWLTTLKNIFATTCSLPSYAYSRGKNSCACWKAPSSAQLARETTQITHSERCHLQSNWLFGVLNPSQFPNLVVMNCKGLEQPKTHLSNAISVATRGAADTSQQRHLHGNKGRCSRKAASALESECLYSRRTSLTSMKLSFLINKMQSHYICYEVQMS